MSTSVLFFFSIPGQLCVQWNITLVDHVTEVEVLLKDLKRKINRSRLRTLDELPTKKREDNKDSNANIADRFQMTHDRWQHKQIPELSETYENIPDRLGLNLRPFKSKLFT